MDPEEQKQYWRSLYRSFRDWEIVTRCHSKFNALEDKTRLAELWDCEVQSEEIGPEQAVWHLYVFEHDGY